MIEAPSARRLLIGAALRRYREDLGFILDDAARVLECDRSKISRIETGQRGIRPKELRELLTEYGVGEQGQSTLTAIARAGSRRQLARHGGDALPGPYREYLALEQAASDISHLRPAAHTGPAPDTAVRPGERDRQPIGPGRRRTHALPAALRARAADQAYRADRRGSTTPGAWRPQGRTRPTPRACRRRRTACCLCPAVPVRAAIERSCDDPAVRRGAGPGRRIPAWPVWRSLPNRPARHRQPYQGIRAAPGIGAAPGSISTPHPRDSCSLTDQAPSVCSFKADVGGPSRAPGHAGTAGSGRHADRAFGAPRAALMTRVWAPASQCSVLAASHRRVHVAGCRYRA